MFKETLLRLLALPWLWDVIAVVLLLCFLLRRITNQYLQLKAAIEAQAQHSEKRVAQECQQLKEALFHCFLQNQQQLFDCLNQFSQQLSQGQQQNLVHLQMTLRENFLGLDKQLHQQLAQTSSQLTQQFAQLNQSTSHYLLKISEAVELKLSKGFEQTHQTFHHIIQRLAMIDEAQKKICDLSKNVLSLQEILSDKRARGAFGEIQLTILIQNVLPANSYTLQHNLSNGTRADCLLKLPEPNGNIIIDAKFPLENYKKAMDPHACEKTRARAKQQFKIDLRKHIQDINQKYIIPGETSDGALMFIPAEAIFAEIHAYHPDIVEYAWQAKVWLASPSTMMAILTTACSVLKDSATRQQMHVIQEHLRLLAQDFTRFEKRMDNLSRHLQQANLDAEQVHTSAQKIAKRFHQIEQVELPILPTDAAAGLSKKSLKESVVVAMAPVIEEN